MIKAWVNDVNSTSLRIIVSIGLAVFMIVALTIAMLFFGWEPSPAQKWVLLGIAGGILTMMGFDVIQFIGKRFSDATLAAAKNPTQPVNVDTPAAPKQDTP